MVKTLLVMLPSHIRVSEFESQLSPILVPTNVEPDRQQVVAEALGFLFPAQKREMQSVITLGVNQWIEDF